MNCTCIDLKCAKVCPACMASVPDSKPKRRYVKRKKTPHGRRGLPGHYNIGETEGNGESESIFEAPNDLEHALAGHFGVEARDIVQRLFKGDKS